MSNIEVIGSINGQSLYEPHYIAELLRGDQEVLGVGNAFVGRPETRIYANDKDIVKIRAELNIDDEKVHKWATNVLHDERRIAVHHPHKTWFIVEHLPDKGALVGNICPRLKPLHIELKPAPETAAERLRYLELLEAVFRIYFSLAKAKGLKLDEGLSNFASDENGSVYYLDDEYYSWDNFVTFTVMLGVFIRTFEWLDEEFIVQLADILIRLIDDIFQDLHCRIIIGTQLQALFMPTAQKKELIAEIIRKLSQKPKHSKALYKKRTKTNGRYYALIADIHANEAALDNVLRFFKERDIDQGIILGDIVGYGPDPRSCIEKVQESPFQIIKGNHDHAVAIGNTGTGFSGNAKIVINWTIEQLDREYRDWLKYLPPVIQDKDWLAVHGAPIDPAFFYGYVYMMTAEDNLHYLQEKNIPLCFHGHSHMPGVYARDKNSFDHHLTQQSVELGKYTNALVCPGSVGQARNGQRHAQCAVYDRQDRIIEFISIEYPIDAVVKKMKHYNLPAQLWERLQEGK